MNEEEKLEDWKKFERWLKEMAIEFCVGQGLPASYIPETAVRAFYMKMQADKESAEKENNELLKSVTDEAKTIREERDSALKRWVLLGGGIRNLIPLKLIPVQMVLDTIRGCEMDAKPVGVVPSLEALVEAKKRDNQSRMLRVNEVAKYMSPEALEHQRQEFQRYIQDDWKVSFDPGLLPPKCKLEK